MKLRPSTTPDLWRPVAGHLLQPLQGAWRGDRSRRYLARVEQLLRLPPERTRKWAFERIRFLLWHAHATVPYWRRRMDEAGFEPRRFRSLDQLQDLPPLTREDVAGYASQLVSTRYRGRSLLETKSGGTTSKPLALVQHHNAAWCKLAAARLFQRRMGWLPGDRVAVLWGTMDRPHPPRSPRQRVQRYIENRWVERALWLPATPLFDDRLDEFADQLERFRPAVLQAYPSAADIFARHLFHRGRRLHVPRIVLTAEAVFEAQRKRIAEAFCAEIFTFYGAREVGWIAEECPAEHRLHLNTAGVHVEVGDEGRLLITDLVDTVAPRLRYDLGDRGRLDDAPCPCGDPRPVFAELHGRALDMFWTPSGHQVPGVLLDVRNWMMDEGLLETQLVQTARDRILVRWVPAPTFTSHALEAYGRFLDSYFNGEFELAFEPAERIEPEPNGKVRYCISLGPPPEA